ncbi:MAG: hypothetical protein WC390_07275 [Sulfurimonas sp.]|jgi:hypothetical protein
MSELGKKALIKFYLNGQQVSAPTDWQGIDILATFDNESTQANITIDKFTFVLTEYQKIIDYINKGLIGGTGITEGFPFKIQTYNDKNNYSVFDGFLNLSDDIEIDEVNGKIKSKIRLSDGLNTLDEQLSALSFGYLQDEKKVFTQSDYTTINYIVEKKLNFLEVIISIIIEYLMIKELWEQTYKAAYAIADAVAHIAGGVTGTLAGTLFTVAVAIINITVFALILTAVMELGKNLINQFIPPKRETKCLNFNTAITKIVQYLGYSFYSNITDLSQAYYLPSNQNYDEDDNFGFLKKVHGTETGIPNISDYGYNCLDFFELAKNLFSAKYAIINNTIYLINEFDNFWIKQSTFKMPSVLNKVKRYNTEELIANRILSFNADITDEWTISNFTGTNYEIITDATITNNSKAKYIKGLEQIQFGVALGNIKEKLNGLENSLAKTAKMIDKVVNTFGGNSDLAGKITSKIGLLKIGTNNWTIPKVLKLSNNKPANRSLWSAKYLYENYHYGKSFVSNNFYGQKTKYNEVIIPFGLNDFIKLINNSYFYTTDGKEAKATEIKWNINSDKAIVSYQIREPYTHNLKETFIET